LAGIQASSVGLTFVAVFLFLQPIIEKSDYLSLGIVIASFLIAQFTKLPSILLFAFGLLFGIWFHA
jgi:hypothetical protein